MRVRVLAIVIGLVLCTTFAFAQEYTLPDDLKELSYIQNECQLNIENIKLKQANMQLQFNALANDLKVWNNRFIDVNNKIKQLAPQEKPNEKTK